MITREQRQTSVGTHPANAGTAGSREGTGVFQHRVDGDGVSRLVIDEPTFAAQPRARRATGAEGITPRAGGDVDGASPASGVAGADARVLLFA